MAGRIRTIKPELLEDERVASLSSHAFRLFVGCLLLADDHGNLRITTGGIGGAVFWRLLESGKITHAEIERAREELIAPGAVVKSTGKRRPGLWTPYMVRGELYAHISGWSKHQRVDRPGPPRVPSRLDPDAEEMINDFTSRVTLATDLDLDPDHDPDLDPDQRNALFSAPGPTAPGFVCATTDDPLLPDVSTLVVATSSAEQSSAFAPTNHGVSSPTQGFDVSATAATLLGALSATKPTAVLAAPATQPTRSKSSRSADQSSEQRTYTSPTTEVFDYYIAGWRRTINGRNPPKLDEKRQRMIATRLKTHSIDDLKLACDGVWLSQWNLENNQYGIDLVLRDTAHVERFMGIATNEAASFAKNSSTVADAPEHTIRGAYVAGIMAESKHGFTLQRAALADLQAIVDDHAKGPDGAKLTGDKMWAWVRDTAAAYYRATLPEARFQRGFQPSGCVVWLNAGRPSSRATSTSGAASGIASDTKFGYTQEQLATMATGRQEVRLDREVSPGRTLREELDDPSLSNSPTAGRDMLCD